MEFNINIEVKNVSPLVVFTHFDKRKVSDLEQTSYELCNIAEINTKESLFCIVDQPLLDDDVEVQVCCPIKNVDLVYHEKKYKIQVLPRILVLTTIHHGEYNDLKAVFEEMSRYIEKNNLVTQLPYRVVFHREKREWDRLSVQKKPDRDYVTEVQIQILAN